MDLYAGGGGFGYLDTRVSDSEGWGRVEIRTDWAVDYEADMAATFKCNFQHTHVSAFCRCGVEGWAGSVPCLLLSWVLLWEGERSGE